MPQNDLLKRYLDAGMAFTSMTQTRAEGIVKNLVQQGELTRDQAQSAVEELVERSQRNTEKLLDRVRKEIKETLGNRGLATKADIERLEAKIAKIEKATKKKPAAKKKSAAKKKAGAKASS